MISYFQAMFKSLNANRAPGELAHAFALGMLLAFVPKGNLLWIFLFIVTFFFRINRGTLFLSIILGSIFIPLLDPLFDSTGYAILTHPALVPTFTKWLDTPFVAFTRFNNTIVMGALAWGIILYIPFYILARLFIRLWRNTLYQYFIRSKVYQLLIRIPLLKLLLKIAEAKHD